VPPLNYRHTSEELAALATEVVRLVNIERVNAGLGELAILPEMMEVARRKSQDMVDYNYYAHYPPEGIGTRISAETGFLLMEYGLSGNRRECIAAGMYTPDVLVKAWMASSGHRAILLATESTHIGVGVAEGAYSDKWTLIVKEVREDSWIKYYN
jgi:uncharacterized protein YkwD